MWHHYQVTSYCVDYKHEKITVSGQLWWRFHGRKKSSEVWLKEGDNSTRFFHTMTSAHMTVESGGEMAEQGT